MSKLEDIPDLIFSIDSVDKVTDSELNEKVYLLQKFANTITKRSEDYSNNAWNNSSVKVVTNELRHDIDSNVSTLINKLNDIDVLFANCCDSFGLDLMPSIANLEKLVDLLAFVSKSPLIPTKWVYDDINSLRSYAQEHKTKTTEITNGKHQLSSVYNDKIFDLRMSQVIQEYYLRISMYMQNNEYLPYKEQLHKDVYTLDYKALGYDEEPVVKSPYSQQDLKIVINPAGDIFIDYTPDLQVALQEGHIYQAGDDIRPILTEDSLFVPAYSMAYTVDENNQPVFMTN